MFKIYDGREQFYQWDIDRKLIVEDADITQVHFCNRTDDCSLVVESYKQDGLTLVNVPNVLLQEDWRINVYAYDKNYTKFSKQFDVFKRSKPESYVYTETEVLNYNILLDKMEGIEDNIGDAVKDYLEENDIDIDLTGYATEKYVDDAIAVIELTPGPVGPTGAPGPKGEDGYTPVKGVDYFDGAPGKDGADGAPGKDGKDGEPGPAGKDGENGKDYVLTEADKQEIAGMVEVSGGGGDSAPEVYVGTEAPTDSNIKIWVDTDEVVEFATTKYVDDAVANIDIPESSGGGASITEIKFNYDGTITDESKAVLQEWISYWGTYSEPKLNTEFYVKTGYGNYVFLTDKARVGGSRYTLTGEAANASYQIIIKSSGGTISSVSYNSSGNPVVSSKDWTWVNCNGSNAVPVHSYSTSHIKVYLGIGDSDIDNIMYDISTFGGNYFYEEQDQRYYNLPTINSMTNTDYAIGIWFHNTSRGLELKDNSGNDLLQNGTMKLLGFYYWG